MTCFPAGNDWVTNHTHFLAISSRGPRSERTYPSSVSISRAIKTQRSTKLTIGRITRQTYVLYNSSGCTLTFGIIDCFTSRIAWSRIRVDSTLTRNQLDLICSTRQRKPRRLSVRAHVEWQKITRPDGDGGSGEVQEHNVQLLFLYCSSGLNVKWPVSFFRWVACLLVEEAATNEVERRKYGHGLVTSHLTCGC